MVRGKPFVELPKAELAHSFPEAQSLHASSAEVIHIPPMCLATTNGAESDMSFSLGYAKLTPVYLIATFARSMSSTTSAISVRPFFDPRM